MQKLIICLAVFLITNAVFSQKTIIRGSVIDTTNKQPLFNAVVYLMSAKDSFLLQFTRVKADGSFEINNVEPSKTILLVSYPNYAEYIDILNIDSNGILDVKSIALISKSKLLQEVIVSTNAKPIKIRGDTTEYTADSFRISPNATVEDLLKKLPGIRVNKTGQIFAQGEKVRQILIDGEEFFSTDPTLVTQNLRADIVDKVQVYDKKNDMGAVTNKTINLKLKEDKKNGYFGKILYAEGENAFFNRKLIYNNFKGKRKFAAYGIWSNIGKEGAKSDEEQDFEDASILNTSDNVGLLDNWTGNYDGKGLPTLKMMALHFDNKWNGAKQSINSNYKITQLNINGLDTQITRYNLPDTSFYVKQSELFQNKVLRNKINGSYLAQIDSFTNLQVGVYAEKTNKESQYNYYINSNSLNNTLLNNEDRTQTANGKLNILNSKINLKRTLNNNKNAIIFDLIQNYKTDNTDGFLFSKDKFYKNGSIVQTQFTDQYKTNRYNRYSFDAKLTYKKDLAIGGYLLTTINWITVNSISYANSYNKGINNGYEILDSLYSNNFKFNTQLFKPQIGYTLINPKVLLISSFGVGKIIYKQINNFEKQTLKNSYVNIFPRLDFTYTIKPRNKIFISYLGSSANPSLQQMQSNKINLNPLNVIVGNSTLKPSFTNYIGLGYFSGKLKAERDVTIRLKYNSVTNDISSQSYIDSFGRTLYQYINVTGNRSFIESFEYNKGIKKINTELEVTAVFKQSRYLNIVNNKLNITNNSTKEINVGLSKPFTATIEAGLDFNFNQTGSKSSLQKSKNSFLAYTITPNIQLHLPKKIEFYCDCNFISNQSNIDFIKKQTATVCNAWFEKNFFKNNDLQIRASVNDIFNKNIGYFVDVNSNFLKQSGYTIIKRYALFTIIWNFNKGNANN